MAKTTNSANGTSTNKKPSATEMREWYEKNKKQLDIYADMKDALLNLKDVSKNTKYRNISSISEEELRSYLENPSNYEVQLRNISRYLVTRSQIYYRIIKYYSNLFQLNARSVIPRYSLTEENNDEEILKSYEDTIKLLDKMGLQYEFLKVYTTCLTEDVFYGMAYIDVNSDITPSMFILPLDPSYCRLQGYWKNGNYAFSFNMDYFKKYSNLLELWGSPFTDLYKQYEKDGKKWQLMPQDSGAICIKFRSEDNELILPPLVGMFNALLNLQQLESITSIANEQEIYKLLVATIPTLAGDEPNNFAVNIHTAVDYFNKLCDALPSYTDAVISPIPIDFISFNDNVQGSDVNKVQNATKTVLNTAGGAQVLNSADVSSSSGYEASFKLDTEFAISSLLPQTEAWVNYFISLYVKNPAKVKFFEVSTYTMKQFRQDLLENSSNGIPNKLAIASLSGFSEMDTLALNHLEENILKLSDKFIPLNTSYTQSGKTDNTKDTDELSDEGEKTRDQDKND